VSAHASHYEAYQARQARLASLIQFARTGFAGLDMATWVETTDKLAARVASERFRVMILGEMKRGKSTFINALLHAEVLPAETTPCTAVINEVKWDENRRAVLYFRQPLPERYPPLPSDARRHIAKHANGEIPPMDIPVNDLPEFVKIPDPTANLAESVAESPYERVEVFWPLELCRNGVEIIDSPGLNEHQTRTKTTRDYLPHIDAVVFVMSVHALAAESELAVIDNELRSAGHEYLFFVCNRFDELRKREDREKVQGYAYAKLADRTQFGREGVFFLSGLDALEGRLNGDATMISRSGIVPLERALERFLVEDRGRIKLLQPAGQLLRGVKSALTQVIPTRRRLLDEDLEGLRKRLDQARPELDQVARRRDTVLKQVEAARQRVRDTVRLAAERFFTDLSQDVPLWVRRMDTRTINPLLVWSIKKQADEVAQQVISGLHPVIEASLEQWERTRLRPLLGQQMTELTEQLNMSVEPFLDYLDGVKARLSGGLQSPSTNVDGMSLQRVLTGTGGAVVGATLVVASLPGIGAAVAAAGLSGVVTAVAGKVGALLLSMVNPVTLAAVVVAGLALHHRRGMALTNQVKTQVAEGVAAQLRAEARDRSAAIADELYQQTESLAESISAGLEREMREVREQVDAIIRHKEQSEAEVRAQRVALDRSEAELRKVDDELNELILSLGHR